MKRNKVDAFLSKLSIREYNTYVYINIYFAQSAGVVEYTDCFLAEE